jgi:hypothetical protein
MPEPGDITPDSTDRGIVIGQTGSGKTYFMRQLLLPIRRLVVCDAKGTLDGPQASGGNWHLEPWNKSTVRDLRKGRPVRIRIPPQLWENPRVNPWSAKLKRVYDAGDCVLYIDENNGVTPPRRPAPYYLNAIYTRGRELGIGAWTASQRPAFIPLEVISEAQWFFLFRVLLDEDRRRMAGFMGSDVMREIPDTYGFWYYHVSWDRAYYSAGLEVTGRKGVA